MKILVEISGALNRGHSLHVLINDVLMAVLKALRAERVMFLSPFEENVQVLAACGIPCQDFSRRVAKQVISTGEALLSLDAGNDDRLSASRSLSMLGTRSILCAPVKTPGRLHGLIYLDNRHQVAAFENPELQLVTVIAEMVALGLERVEHLESLNRSQEEEEQLRHSHKMRAIARLAGGVAHDFNNIMTTIIGSCDFIKPPDTESEKAGGEIRAQAERAASLTHQLLSFGRDRPRNARVFDWNSETWRVRDMLCRLAGAQVDLQYDLFPEPLMIKADPHELNQTLFSLVINAREAMPCGGHLMLSTFKEGSEAVLVMRDNGNGMDDETKQRAFEPFFSTKQHGVGLGLTTAYGVIGSSGGEIRLRSSPGRGTEITVTFPLVSLDLEGPRETSSVGIRGEANILVVEDEPAVGNLLSRRLKKEGFLTVHLLSAEEALKMDAELEDFDLLLSDVVLPGMNGLELARRLQAKHPSLKVILMSGYCENILDQTEGEAYPFLDKPFQLEEMTSLVKAVLAK